MSDFIKKNKSTDGGRLLPKKNHNNNKKPNNSHKDKTYKYLEELQEKTVKEFNEKKEMETKMIREIIGAHKPENPVLSEENTITNLKERNEYIMNNKNNVEAAKKNSDGVPVFKVRIKNAYTGEVIKEFGNNDSKTEPTKKVVVSEPVNKASEEASNTKIEDIEAVVAPDIENRIKDPVEEVSDKNEESSIAEDKSEDVEVNSDEYLTMDDFVNNEDDEDEYDFEFDDDDEEESSVIDPINNPMGE